MSTGACTGQSLEIDNKKNVELLSNHLKHLSCFMKYFVFLLLVAIPGKVLYLWSNLHN